MIAEGLLWYDDDPRRAFDDKIAEAAQRFSERTGWAPTSCEVNPATLNAPAPKGKRKASQPDTSAPKHAGLQLTPNASLRPNYFLVGIEAGARPRLARQQRQQRQPRRSASTNTAAPRTDQATGERAGRKARGTSKRVSA